MGALGTILSAVVVASLFAGAMLCVWDNARQARRQSHITDRPRPTPSPSPPPKRTELGERLQAIRNRIVAGGQPLRDWDGISRERAERRGQPD